jgi:hypothetical protein
MKKQNIIVPLLLSLLLGLWHTGLHAGVGVEFDDTDDYVVLTDCKDCSLYHIASLVSVPAASATPIPFYIGRVAVTPDSPFATESYFAYLTRGPPAA